MLTRRSLLTGAALGLPLAAAHLTRTLRPAMAQAVAPKTFVLARGSWPGGWCWKRVADRLRGEGHAVYTPSYSGMGDRVHLLHKEITIETFVEDLVQVIESEELTQVVLVGHGRSGGAGAAAAVCRVGPGEGRRSGLRLGAATALPASVAHLHHGTDAAGAGRQQPAAHLRALHAAVASCAGGFATARAFVGGLAVGRPRGAT